MKKQRIRQHPNAKTSGILDPKFKYTRSAQTDILRTFLKMGWTPPSLARLHRSMEA